MSFNFSPKIVTDGLVLYLDAANTKSYTSGNTTWNDISRSGNNGTLTNGPTFNSDNGGNVVFDGTNDYIDITSSTSTIQNLTAQTISIWTKIDSTNASPSCLLFYGDTTFSNYAVMYLGDATGTWTDESLYIFVLNTVGLAIRNGHTYYYDNKWHNFVYTTNASGNKLYVDGILQTVEYNLGNSSTNGVFKSGVSTLSFNIGRRNFTGFSTLNTKMNLSNISIYNKAFSAKEVTQNYNAIKSRFGL